MKRTWRIAAITLLLVASSVRCSKMDGPEAAAKVNFSEWAVNIRAPYRHEKFQTINNDGTVSTVRITVEIKIDGNWTEKQIEIQCEKVDDDWQCDRWMQLDERDLNFFHERGAFAYSSASNAEGCNFRS